MSSRQEEKERRRREREERERAEARKAAGRRRVQLVAGGVLGIAVIVAVVLAVAGGGGGDDDGGPSASGGSEVAIPAGRIADFDAAVKASRCTFATVPNQGRDHLESNTATFDGYKDNPPTSGNHAPEPAQDGVYAADNPPTTEASVHALEHGRINIQYSAKAPQLVRDQLETLFNEELEGVEGYHQLLYQNQTNMPYEVAATAWTHSLTCDTMNPQVFDAIRAFRARFVDKGPELIP